MAACLGGRRPGDGADGADGWTGPGYLGLAVVEHPGHLVSSARASVQSAQTLPARYHQPATRSVLTSPVAGARWVKSLENKPSEGGGRNVRLLRSRPRRCELCLVRGRGPQISQMQFPVFGPGWDDRQFWLQLQPRRQSDPTLQNKPLQLKFPLIARKSVAARPWSSPA